MHPMRTSLCILAAALLTAGAARSASVTVTNPGFEADVLAAGGWSDATPTGWRDPTGDAPAGDNSNFIEYIGGFVSEGVNHVGFDANEYGLLFQDLSTAWAPNTKYTLTFGVGNRNAANFAAGTGRFGFGSSTEGDPLPLTPYAPLVFSQDIFTGTYATVASTFADTSITFTTGAVAPAGNIRISVQNLDTGTRLHVDNFRLDATPIPEPASIATLALASGLLMRRRRA